jgi:hypothetical protein
MYRNAGNIVSTPNMTDVMLTASRATDGPLTQVIRIEWAVASCCLIGAPSLTDRAFQIRSLNWSPFGGGLLVNTQTVLGPPLTFRLERRRDIFLRPIFGRHTGNTAC